MIDKAQFYTLLAATPRDWYATPGGFIRRLSAAGQCECPVSSIHDRPFQYVHSVSKEIGLSIHDVARIVDAADLNEPFDRSIRAELLRACGLTSQPLNEKEKLKP